MSYQYVEQENGFYREGHWGLCRLFLDLHVGAGGRAISNGPNLSARHGANDTAVSTAFWLDVCK